MKTKKVVAELICFLLMLNFFYEGIYKIAYLQQYGLWVTHEPFIKYMGKALTYLVPLMEMTLSIMIVTPSKRHFALWSVIIIEVVFIFWVVSVYLFTSYLFWPYQALWIKSTWMEKMSFALLVSWLAFTAIILSGNQLPSKKVKQKAKEQQTANVV